MGKYQLPPLKNGETFQDFVCDVFNERDKEASYVDAQVFGVKGQRQKGIDVICQKTGTVIQCKVKDLRKTDAAIRKDLIRDIDNDLDKAKSLRFKVNKFILASTFRDDAKLQEYVASLKGGDCDFDCYYMGWDTLSRYAEESEPTMKKYFPNLRQKRSKAKRAELPENALGRELSKKNYVRYLIERFGDWKQKELKEKGRDFNWGSFQKGLMRRYRATGINHINIEHFDSVCAYLQERIDRTIMGKFNKSRGIKNYSTYEEQQADLKKL